MTLLLSSFAGSLVKAVIYGILAFIGIKLGKKVSDMRKKK